MSVIMDRGKKTMYNKTRSLDVLFDRDKCNIRSLYYLIRQELSEM